MHRGYSFCKGASISGSHHQYKHPTKPGKVTIPRHIGDLDRGTVNSILRQAGLK
ncbi:type II toxin-antitoxin system HicA family toxin [Anaerovibrio sp.]|uniref:type II toxin-antitoxin system HicA family toxin n=1 Tax=Anaerovibrio sp. TaxID=1872532 RepID=UPI002611B817|nr:type II toxin-antitoxin system HicA family toxin [Anaerovibrio sp.]MDD6598786.1 type II toxin-antitoxin system HicA family toxin [Anaerovibrio sp.]